MKYRIGYDSDIGSKKEVNQDSLCIKKAASSTGEILLAVICDGMGGLSKGELASAAVIKEFSKWFASFLVDAAQPIDTELVKAEWNRLIEEVNQRIYQYGIHNQIQLGTTVTALLMEENGKYVIAHVGDTRAYLVKKNDITQLTKDHTFVAREVLMGRMSKEQAEVDVQKNVLLQCIGASKVLEIETEDGFIEKDSFLLLCSDGFRHKISNEEIRQDICSRRLKTEDDMTRLLQGMVKKNIAQGETDNISAILIKAE